MGLFFLPEDYGAIMSCQHSFSSVHCQEETLCLKSIISFAPRYRSATQRDPWLHLQAHTSKNTDTDAPQALAEKLGPGWSGCVEMAFISCWVQSDMLSLTGYQCLRQRSPSPNKHTYKPPCKYQSGSFTLHLQDWK